MAQPLRGGSHGHDDNGLHEGPGVVGALGRELPEAGLEHQVAFALSHGRATFGSAASERLLRLVIADQATVVEAMGARLAVEVAQFVALLQVAVECRDDEAFNRKAGDRAEV